MQLTSKLFQRLCFFCLLIGQHLLKGKFEIRQKKCALLK